MFERFNPEAKAAIIQSQHEARQLGNDQIGVTHLLLGLSHGERMSPLFAQLGFDIAPARRLAGVAIAAAEAVPTGHIPFSEAAKKVLELSLREALQFGHNWIGAEHIAIAVVRAHDGARPVGAPVDDAAGDVLVAGTGTKRHDLLMLGQVTRTALAVADRFRPNPVTSKDMQRARELAKEFHDVLTRLGDERAG